MIPLVKICGVTRPEDAALAVAAGARFIGINFWRASKRWVELERGAEVAASARAAGGLVVGVFVDPTPEEVARVVAAVALDAVQLHGQETPAQVETIATAARCSPWKAVAVASADDLNELARWPVDVILLDTASPDRGGTGQAWDWTLARTARTTLARRRVVLAGGLHAGNVKTAISIVQPWAVDVASGAEVAPGIKDRDKVRDICAAVLSMGDEPIDATEPIDTLEDLYGDEG